MDIRQRCRHSTARLPNRCGRICPRCGCRALAYSSTHAFTYYRFACGAESYKQPRSIEAITILRNRITRFHANPCSQEAQS